MTPDLEEVRPARRLLRVGRLPDPWAWPAWEYAGADGTFGNRWDDPQDVYRVLYACTDLQGGFVEVLSRFRPDPAVVAGLRAIEGADEGEPLPPGIVPRSFLERRCIGEAAVPGVFADIGTAASLAHLHVALASRLIHYGFAELDAAAIRHSAPRQFTQEISRYVYERSNDRGEPKFRGIEYESRFGDDFHNWAIFERVGETQAVVNPSAAAIRPDDPALNAALALLGVTLR